MRRVSRETLQHWRTQIYCAVFCHAAGVRRKHCYSCGDILSFSLDLQTGLLELASGVCRRGLRFWRVFNLQLDACGLNCGIMNLFAGNVHWDEIFALAFFLCILWSFAFASGCMFSYFFIRLYASFLKIGLDKKRLERLSVVAGLGFGTLISAAGLFMWIEILFSLLAGSALIIALAAVCAEKAERDLAPGGERRFCLFLIFALAGLLAFSVTVNGLLMC